MLLVCTAVSAISLVFVRYRTNGEEEGFAFMSALLFVGGLLGFLLLAYTKYGPALDDYCKTLPWWLGTTVKGVAFAITLYLGMRFFFAFGCFVYLWACRRNPGGEQTVAFWWREQLWTAVGFLIVGMLIQVLWAWVDSAGRWADLIELLSIIFVLALFPLYVMWALPWLLYHRSQTLDAGEYGDIYRWLDDLRAQRKLPKFLLRVHEGKMVNATVSGGIYRHFIVVGRGLLDQISVEHLKAILAHEIGHILNRDQMRGRVPLLCGTAVLFAIYLKYFTLELDTELLRVASITVGVVFFWYVLPGFWWRRWEYRADQRAAELMGDGEPLACALLKFSEINNINMDQWSLTHPPMRSRIETLRRLSAQGS